jgi:predicted hotdog family 3-hydroxylacyl-ACP dehydratase
MILLDEMVDFAPGRARCAVRLRPDSPFLENGRVRAVVAVEYMAQAVAAYAGMCSHQDGKPPSIGFLLGTRELTLAVDFFQAGDALAVDVEHVFGDDQLGSFRCSVRRGDEIVSEAVLNVYQHKGGGLPPV